MINPHEVTMFVSKPRAACRAARRIVWGKYFTSKDDCLSHSQDTSRSQRVKPENVQRFWPKGLVYGYGLFSLWLGIWFSLWLWLWYMVYGYGNTRQFLAYGYLAKAIENQPFIDVLDDLHKKT